MLGLPHPRPGRCPQTPGLWCWYANAQCMSREGQICVKRGDRYALVDTAQLDLGHHRTTLTPPGASPLVIATPMVTKATYNKAQGGLVLVPSALGAQQLRDAEWKGWSGSGKSYVRALRPSHPVGFKLLGARAQALRDWIVPKLTSKRPARTPSLTTVFGLIGRDLRAA